jgi:inner membrane protein
MEPVTHLLTGACLSRAGFNRRAAYATLTMVIAAELPDIDTLWGLRGSVEGFQHHRGITHTFLGLPFEAALLVAGVYGLHRWRVARADARGRETNETIRRLATFARGGGEERARAGRPFALIEMPPRETSATTVRDAGDSRDAREARATLSSPPLTAAPVRWGVLYGLALLALLSHLLLDYTNNYGLRPFFPFKDRWYAASIAFIVDPVMLALLLGALVAPWLFGLVSAEVGAKKQPFHGRGWAIAALLGVVSWWGLRTVEHARAVQMAMAQSYMAPVDDVPAPPMSQKGDMGHPDLNPNSGPEPVPVYLPVQRALASPDLLNPFRWSAVMDFGPVYQMAEIDTLGGTVAMGETTYAKPGSSAAVLAAERSKLGRVYMDWSPMPFVEAPPDSVLVGEGGDSAGPAKIVTFRDPRFMGGRLRDAGRTALVGTVELDAADRVVGETMDGKASSK